MEVDGPFSKRRAAIFEEVEGDGPRRPSSRRGEGEDELEEFEPVTDSEPIVHWEDEEHWEVVEERWEAYLEDLFSDFDADEEIEEADLFEEVEDDLGWSKGEVVWEGMDFDLMFTDLGEYEAFELMSRRDKRAFLRERLRTCQASTSLDAEESEVDEDLGPPPRREAPARAPPRVEQGPLVSYETETEHRAEDLDVSQLHRSGKRRRRSGD